MPLSTIRAEDEVFAAEGQVGIGAIREVHPDRLLAHVEGYGEVTLRPEHIRAAHDRKVVLRLEALPEDLLQHLAHAHDAEYPRPSDT
ncbi:hypothetical protein [Jannaschia formosa]|uniref:hypothetical protein n=1 Tax=Jannaschia formosa TaxID=2259592 RepID=UPI000E1B8726|nr:hypothetical protein [Jannaschia formosa]TFL19895.1 hypothetical protein DR046_00670 [Jannaschia formosa]